MNFLNFLTSKSSLFNFNLISQTSHHEKENTILIEPTKDNSSFLPVIPTQNPSVSSSSALKLIGSPEQEFSFPKNLSTLLTQEQMLINQYMELKLKQLATYLNTEVQAKQPKQTTLLPEEVTEKVNDQKEDQNSLRKKIKKQNKCGHDDKIHYAKGMCNNCYHKYGRTKKPWNCPHNKLYAAGMCQNCYINNYNRKKREEKDEPDKIQIQDIEQNEEEVQSHN